MEKNTPDRFNAVQVVFVGNRGILCNEDDFLLLASFDAGIKVWYEQFFVCYFFVVEKGGAAW